MIIDNVDTDKSGAVNYGNFVTALRLNKVSYRPYNEKLRHRTKGDAEQLLNAWKVEDPVVRKLLRGTAARPGALGTMVNVLKLARILATPAGGLVTAEHIQLAHDQLSVEAA